MANINFKICSGGDILYTLDNGVAIMRNSYLKEKRQFDENTGISKAYYIGSDGNEYEIIIELIGGTYHTTNIRMVV